MDVMCEICGAMDTVKLVDDGQWVCLWMCKECAHELEVERDAVEDSKAAIMRCEQLHEAEKDVKEIVWNWETMGWSESGTSNALCNLAMPIALLVFLVVLVVALDVQVDLGYVPRLLGM